MYDGTNIQNKNEIIKILTKKLTISGEPGMAGTDMEPTPPTGPFSFAAFNILLPGR
jgi:hypothetical protein